MSSKVTYRQQFTRCGKQRCQKCQQGGAGHGPYWYAYWSENGRTVSKYIGIHLPPEAEASVVENKEIQTPSPPPGNIVEIPSSSQPTLRIYVLGQFRVEQRRDREWVIVTNHSWHRRRARALLGCLLSHPGRRIGREQAMEELWPDLEIEIAANRLNGAVHELRQILEPELSKPATSRLLRLERDVLELANNNHIWVDADAFEALLKEAYATTDPEKVANLLEQAEELYHGDYLLEELYSEWSVPRRDALKRSWMGLLLKLSDLRAAQGAYLHAIVPLNRLLSSDAINEPAIRRLMYLLTQLDRRGEALHIYQQLVERLDEYDGSSPLPETQELYEAVRQGQIRATQPAIPPQESKETTPAREVRVLHEQTGTYFTENLPSNARQLGRSNQGPLIGRDQEMEILRQFLQASETNENRKPHFLLLTGEPGIGKTRLAEELSQQASTKGWAVVWSRSYEQEGTIPYRPWIEVLRMLLQGASAEFLVSSLQKHTLTVEDTVPLRLEHLSTLLTSPDLLSLAHAKEAHSKNGKATVALRILPPEQERLLLWETTLAILNATSSKAPLLLVLDDLHWADESSYELLAYLVRHIQDQRILLLGTCRLHELPQAHSLRNLINDLRREQVITTLPIQPLTQSQIGTMVGHLPTPLIRNIQTLAAGNPFFAEELARVSEPTHQQTSANEGQAIEGVDFSTTLPEAIAAVLERRLNRLSSECQTLLGKAAVLGGSFELDQLLIMASEPGEAASSIAHEEEILDLLEEALNAGLLTEEEKDTHILYHFWHPLIVSHLYDRLSAARRTQLHRRAAKAIIQAHRGHEEIIAATVTHHLSKGSGDSQQLAYYAELAGNQAYALAAFSDTQRYYLQAIQAIIGTTLPVEETAGIILPDKSKALHVARLLEKICECTMLSGNFAETRRYYNLILTLRNQHIQSLNESERMQEAQIQAMIWREIGRTWSATGDYPYAYECYARGKRTLSEAGIVTGTIWACLLLQYGATRCLEGFFEEGRRYVQEAREMLEQAMVANEKVNGRITHSNRERATRIERAIIGDPLELGRAYELQGIIAASQGQLTEALQHLHTALALCEKYDLIVVMAKICGNLGAVYAMKADNASARIYLLRAQNLAERLGDLPNMTFTAGNLGELAARSGNPQEAETWFRRSLALSEQLNDREHMSWCSVALAAILQDQGNIRGALRYIRQGLSLGRAMNNSRCISFALLALSDFYILRAIIKGELLLPEQETISPKARHLLLLAQRTLQRLSKLEGREAENIVEGKLLLATLYFLLGEIETARQMAYQTLKEAQEHELTRVRGRSQRLLGRILAAEGAFEQADDFFEQSLTVFREYEMRLDYARVLHGYGMTLLQRNKPDQPGYAKGLDYMHEAHAIFSTCGIPFDLHWVNHILDNYKQPEEQRYE